MNKSSSHKSNGTRPISVVKLKTATAGRIRFEVTLNDLLAVGFDKACKEKGLTEAQMFEEMLESALIRGGFLPSWWRNRQF